jgi:hypothetical protein
MKLHDLFEGNEQAYNWHSEPEQRSMDATRQVRLNREREPEGSEDIDARLRAQNDQLAQYAQSGNFWLKQKDTQEHISDAMVGKAAANAAAVELLKQRPELKGNLVITAYGPGESQGVAEGNESSIKKKIQAKQDSLSLAREQRRAKGQRGVQGQREIKLQAEINRLNTELTQLKKQGVAEAQTDYQKRRQRERDIDAGRPVKALPKNPQTDYARKRAKDRRDMELGEKIGDRHDPDDFDDMVLRLKKLAGAGPMKTVWDPAKRVYKNVPTAVQPKK